MLRRRDKKPEDIPEVDCAPCLLACESCLEVFDQSVHSLHLWLRLQAALCLLGDSLRGPSLKSFPLENLNRASQCDPGKHPRAYDQDNPRGLGFAWRRGHGHCVSQGVRLLEAEAEVLRLLLWRVAVAVAHSYGPPMA